PLDTRTSTRHESAGFSMNDRCIRRAVSTLHRPPPPVRRKRRKTVPPPLSTPCEHGPGGGLEIGLDPHPFRRVRRLSFAVAGADQDRGGAPELPRRQHVLRSEEHTSELQSREKLVCRLLLEKK